MVNTRRSSRINSTNNSHTTTTTTTTTNNNNERSPSLIRTRFIRNNSTSSTSTELDINENNQIYEDNNNSNNYNNNNQNNYNSQDDIDSNDYFKQAKTGNVELCSNSSSSLFPSSSFSSSSSSIFLSNSTSSTSSINRNSTITRNSTFGKSLSLSTASHPRDPINVQINLQIFRVHKIDSSTEEYTIDCGLSFKWVDPYLVDKLNGISFSSHPAIVSLKPRAKGSFDKWPSELIVGETVFDPAWKISNTSDVKIIKNISQVLDSSIGLVHNYVHVQATIFQTLDLSLFPFDHQSLTVRIQSEHVKDVMKFQPIDGVKPLIYQNETASEWIVDEKSIEANFDTNNYQQAASGQRYVAMTYSFKVSRRPDWYISSVFLISYFIVTSSFSIYFIDANHIGERLSILFTTWLMLISLKFIISDRLPKIAYLTLLDIFLGCSYLIMMMLILLVCFTPLFVSIWSTYFSDNTPLVRRLLYPENYTLGFLLSFWTIISFDTCLGEGKILSLFQGIIKNWNKNKNKNHFNIILYCLKYMTNLIVDCLETYKNYQDKLNNTVTIEPSRDS